MRDEDLVARGRTAEIYRYQKGTVVKLFYPWCPGEWAEREAENSRVVSAFGLAMPKYHGPLDLEGRKGLLFEEIEGESLLKQLQRNPFSAREVGRILAESHFRIHCIQTNALPSLRDYLTQSLEKVDVLSVDTRQRIRVILEGLQDGNCLCHYDFHPDQILRRDGRSYIVDWMTAFRGNPMADLARTSILLHFGSPPEKGIVRPLLVRWVGKTLGDSYLHTYTTLSGLNDPQALLRWSIPVAAARLLENIPHEKNGLIRFIEKNLATLIDPKGSTF